MLLDRAAGAGTFPAGRRPQPLPDRPQHLRRLHDQRLQRQLHRPRAGDRPSDAGLSALLPRDVPDADVRHEPGAARQQHRPDVGGDRTGDADHRADGRHLPHPRGAGSGVEVLHPRQRRHRAGAVRHHPRLSRGTARCRPGRRCDGVDGADCPRPVVRSGAAQSRLRLPPARLRHQGRAGAAARVAARRPRRRPDADLGGAVGAAAQRRPLRRAALQDSADGQCGGAGAGIADDRHGARLGRVRRADALSPARHQADVRLLVDRAHGHHHLRLRHGRTARRASPGCCIWRCTA